MARTGSLPVNGPYPKLVEPRLDLIDPVPLEQKGNRSIEDGVLKIDNEDGTTTIDFNASIGDMDDDDDDDGGETAFSRNLAKKISQDELSRIASDLLEGIERDEQSR